VNHHSVISANHYESEEGERFEGKQLEGVALPHGEKVELGVGALNPNNV
jgi:hypothetical protein